MRRGALPRSLSRHIPTNAARSQRHICCYNHLFTRSRREEESGSCPYPPTPEPPGPPSPVLLHLDGSGAAETACDPTCVPKDGRLYFISSDKIKISVLGKKHLCFSNKTSGSKVRQTCSKGSFCVHWRLQHQSHPPSRICSIRCRIPVRNATYLPKTHVTNSPDDGPAARQTCSSSELNPLPFSQSVKSTRSKPARHARARMLLSVTKPVPSPSIPSAVPARHVRHNPEKRKLH